MLRTSFGEVVIDVPVEPGGFLWTKVNSKDRDDSDIEVKVLSVYARGMSQRDIVATVEDIYDFDISHEMISNIIDAVLPKLEEYKKPHHWPSAMLLYSSIVYMLLYEKTINSKKYLYTTFPAIISKGIKYILELWSNQTESKNRWLQMFYELKAH